MSPMVLSFSSPRRLVMAHRSFIRGVGVWRLVGQVGRQDRGNGDPAEHDVRHRDARNRMFRRPKPDHFIDERADVEMAIRIADNAKTQRYSPCNTMETLLVHEKIAPRALPPLASTAPSK